jgi:hypothetical protein
MTYRRLIPLRSWRDPAYSEREATDWEGTPVSYLARNICEDWQHATSSRPGMPGTLEVST